MIATLYNNKSDRIVLNKQILSLGTTNSIKYKDDTDLLRPKFIMKASENFVGVNYIYVGEDEEAVSDTTLVNRYFFVNNVTFSKGYMILDCEGDVLMSFKEQIQDIECVVGRNSTKWNMYLNDDRLEILNQRRVLTFPFPNGFRNMYSSQKKASYILTLSGSGQEITPQE